MELKNDLLSLFRPKPHLRPVADWSQSVAKPEGKAGKPSRVDPGEVTFDVAKWMTLSQAGKAPRLFARLPDLHVDEPEVRMGLIGDTGKGTQQAFDIGQSFARYRQDQQLHMLIHTGDIIYERGAKSVDDPQWKEKVEDPFRGAGPMHYVRGNHDDNNAEFGILRGGGEIDVYKAYGEKNPDFIFPGPFYSRKVHFQGGSLEVFFVDTPVLKNNPQLKKAIEAEVAASDAKWKMVVGHHALVSYGEHGSDKDLARSLHPTVKRHADMYAGGHEHDKQILQDAQVLYLVTGTGSETRPTGWGPETVAADSEVGFSDVRVNKDGISVAQIHADDHRRTHTHLHERPEAIQRRKKQQDERRTQEVAQRKAGRTRKII